MGTYIGKVASSNAWTTNELPVDLFPEMRENFEGETPLTAILTRIEQLRGKQIQHDWIESETLPHRVKFTGATESSTGNTTIYIDDYTAVALGDMIFVPRTKEYLRISAAVTSRAITVTRGVGDSSEGNIRSGEYLELCGTAIEEGIAGFNNARAAVNSRQYNYQQIMNERTDTTKSVDATVTEFIDKRTENQNKMWRAYRIKVEKSLYFGYRASYAGSSLNIRTMGGLIQWLNSGTNRLVVPTFLNESMLDNWLNDIWTNRSDVKVLTLFCSPYLATKINNICKGNIQMSPNGGVYGFTCKQYQGAINMDIVPCPLMRGPELRGWGFLLDLNNIKMKYLRPPVLKKFVNTEDDDFIRDKIESEISMMVINQNRHGMITGVKA